MLAVRLDIGRIDLWLKFVLAAEVWLSKLLQTVSKTLLLLILLVAWVVNFLFFKISIIMRQGQFWDSFWDTDNFETISCKGGLACCSSNCCWTLAIYQLQLQFRQNLFDFSMNLLAKNKVITFLSNTLSALKAKSELKKINFFFC